MKKLITEAAIREALTKLPKTLDETYERILKDIPDENQIYAHRALQMLAFDLGIYSLEALAECIVIESDQWPFSSERQLIHPRDLLEICSCLITISGPYNPADNYHNVELAHYSVKEYLISERIRTGHAAKFYTSDLSANVFAAKSAITYLLNVDYQDLRDSNGPFSTIKSEKTHYFLYCAVTNWQGYARRVENQGGDSTVTDLVLKLLNPSGPHFRGFIEQSGVHHDEGFGEHLPKWILFPGAQCSVTLAYTCFSDLIGAARTFLLRNSDLSIFGNRLELDPECYGKEGLEHAYGTPAQMAVALGKLSFISLFIENGADINGADTGGLRADTTLLQLAVSCQNIDIVKMLLDAKADVNAVGNDDAVVASIKSRYSGFEDDEISVEMEEEIHDRGKWDKYDTPLRIAEKNGLIDIKFLLWSHGAKSLHLFPVKGLPGYVEEDIKAIS